MTGTEPTCFREHLVYLAPFIGFGAAGGLIREMNDKSFSWKELLIRVITGSFGALLVGLYLKHSAYPYEMQCAIAGGVGATACELIRSVQHWIMRKLGGEPDEVDNSTKTTMDLISDGDTASSNGNSPDIHDDNKSTVDKADN